MANSGVDKNRRRLLIAATSVVGGAGVAAMATPFLMSMSPSARALAAGAPVEVDVSKVEPGQLIRVVWQGKPVWVVKRTEAMLATLPKLDDRLRDPASLVETQQPTYAQNPYRSRKPEDLILIGICTHLGCSPTYRPEVAPADLGANWLGGWYCACHGSRFDLAGRVFKNVPAATNLVVPPYYYLDDNTILIGENGGAA
ncbi:MAG: ubiquinol-cytochrome c reductase iron-sulfur subunit [Proteobacteria bacterium]|nr:MAG: ubiquinol-cytochrome c reductase iron-sulfur subunit [Pseudomonadota bacterium]